MKRKEIDNTRTNENRVMAQNILASNKSDDVKLFEVFQLYKDNIRKDYTELYYALLGWKDSHLAEIHKEQTLNIQRR